MMLLCNQSTAHTVSMFECKRCRGLSGAELTSSADQHVAEHDPSREPITPLPVQTYTHAHSLAGQTAGNDISLNAVSIAHFSDTFDARSADEAWRAH